MVRTYTVNVSYGTGRDSSLCIVAITHARFGIVGRSCGKREHLSKLVGIAKWRVSNNRRNGWLGMKLRQLRELQTEHNCKSDPDCGPGLCTAVYQGPVSQ